MRFREILSRTTLPEKEKGKWRKSKITITTPLASVEWGKVKLKNRRFVCLTICNRFGLAIITRIKLLLLFTCVRICMYVYMPFELVCSFYDNGFRKEK